MRFAVLEPPRRQKVMNMKQSISRPCGVGGRHAIAVDLLSFNGAALITTS